MKNITLSTAEIREIILQPSNDIITVSYQVKDNIGNIIFSKSTSLKIKDLPQAGQNSLSHLAQRLLDKVTSIEGL
jgi:hypothetical protein